MNAEGLVAEASLALTSEGQALENRAKLLGVAIRFREFPIRMRRTSLATSSRLGVAIRFREFPITRRLVWPHRECVSVFQARDQSAYVYPPLNLLVYDEVCARAVWEILRNIKRARAWVAARQVGLDRAVAEIKRQQSRWQVKVDAEVAAASLAQLE